MFTDIGQLNVHVIPFRELTADQVYRRVRNWVDSYYEINRDTLDYWSSVEKKVQRLAQASAGSLQAVRDLQNRCRQDWWNLRQIRVPAK